MNTSEILNAAADHIAAFGLHKGRAFPPDHEGSVSTAPLCSVGAITLYGGVDKLAALDALAEHVGVRPHETWLWSDAPERTAEDVVAAFRAAAAVEELREADAAPIPVAQTVEVGA